jgi:hypothetical protein
MLDAIVVEALQQLIAFAVFPDDHKLVGGGRGV